MTLAIAAFATPVEATRSHHGDFQMISMGLGRYAWLKSGTEAREKPLRSVSAAPKTAIRLTSRAALNAYSLVNE